MISVDRDALICDLAETYHIFDFSSVPILLLATLCVGLHDDSRIKMRMVGHNKVAPSYALVNVADTLSMILHVLGGEKNNKPNLLSDIVIGKQQDNRKSAGGFSTPEEFEAERKRIING